MYVVGRVHFDAQKRANISGLFGTKEVKHVVLAISIDEEMIEIIPADDGVDFGGKLTIDSKNRIYMPQWIMDQIKTPNEMYLVYDSGKYYISQKTGDFI